MIDAAYWIERLRLLPHPEGGYYRETYRASDQIGAEALERRFGAARSASTAIYFLLTSADFSSLHRMKSDEAWHYHVGSPLTVHAIDPNGNLQTYKVGLGLDDGQQPQAVVPGGHWFGATVDEPGGYSLVSCTVAPGFDFEDFELGDRQHLTRLYPQHQTLIERLTR